MSPHKNTTIVDFLNFFYNLTIDQINQYIYYLPKGSLFYYSSKAPLVVNNNKVYFNEKTRKYTEVPSVAEILQFKYVNKMKKTQTEKERADFIKTLEIMNSEGKYLSDDYIWGNLSIDTNIQLDSKLMRTMFTFITSIDLYFINYEKLQEIDTRFRKNMEYPDENIIITDNNSLNRIILEDYEQKSNDDMKTISLLNILLGLKGYPNKINGYIDKDPSDSKKYVVDKSKNYPLLDNNIGYFCQETFIANPIDSLVHVCGNYIVPFDNDDITFIKNCLANILLSNAEFNYFIGIPEIGNILTSRKYIDKLYHYNNKIREFLVKEWREGKHNENVHHILSSEFIIVDEIISVLKDNKPALVVANKMQKEYHELITNTLNKIGNSAYYLIKMYFIIKKRYNENSFYVGARETNKVIDFIDNKFLAEKIRLIKESHHDVTNIIDNFRYKATFIQLDNYNRIIVTKGNPSRNIDSLIDNIRNISYSSKHKEEIKNDKSTDRYILDTESSYQVGGNEKDMFHLLIKNYYIKHVYSCEEYDYMQRKLIRSPQLIEFSDLVREKTYTLKKKLSGIITRIINNKMKDNLSNILKHFSRKVEELEMYMRVYILDFYRKNFPGKKITYNYDYNDSNKVFIFSLKGSGAIYQNVCNDKNIDIDNKANLGCDDMIKSDKDFNLCLNPQLRFTKCRDNIIRQLIIRVRDILDEIKIKYCKDCVVDLEEFNKGLNIDENNLGQEKNGMKQSSDNYYSTHLYVDNTFCVFNDVKPDKLSYQGVNTFFSNETNDTISCELIKSHRTQFHLLRLKKSYLTNYDVKCIGEIIDVSILDDIEEETFMWQNKNEIRRNEYTLYNSSILECVDMGVTIYDNLITRSLGKISKRINRLDILNKISNDTFIKNANYILNKNLYTPLIINLYSQFACESVNESRYLRLITSFIKCIIKSGELNLTAEKISNFISTKSSHNITKCGYFYKPMDPLFFYTILLKNINLCINGMSLNNLFIEENLNVDYEIKKNIAINNFELRRQSITSFTTNFIREAQSSIDFIVGYEENDANTLNIKFTLDKDKTNYINKLHREVLNYDSKNIYYYSKSLLFYLIEDGYEILVFSINFVGKSKNYDE